MKNGELLCGSLWLFTKLTTSVRRGTRGRRLLNSLGLSVHGLSSLLGSSPTCYHRQVNIQQRATLSQVFVTHLILGINHQRPPSPLSHQNAIFSWYQVSGQSVCVPLPDFVGISKNVNETEGWVNRDIQGQARLDPALYKLCKEEHSMHLESSRKPVAGRAMTYWSPRWTRK